MPRICERRGGRAGRARAACALAALLAVALSGCASAKTRPADWRVAQCVGSPGCATTLPPCGPAVTSSTFQSGIWYGGIPLPANTARFMGFPLLLPTAYPPPTPGVLDPRAFKWQGVLVLRHATQQGGPPLLQAGYSGYPIHTYGQHQTVVVLEETEGQLGPLTNLHAFDPRSGPLTVADHVATQVGDAPATLYHIVSQDLPRDQLSVLIWMSGPVTLRLLAAADGGATFVATERPGPDLPFNDVGDLLSAGLSAAATDLRVEQLAQRVTTFTCPQ